MWKTVLLVGLVFCTCQAGKSPLFLVTFPGVISVGSEAKLCASFFYITEPLNLTILLKDNDKSTVLFNKWVEQDFYECVQFEPPHVHTDSVQFIEAEVRGKSVQVRDKKKVLFIPSKFITLIKTDKPFYKQGQTVHFRIFSADMHFKPINQQCLFHLQNPSGHIIGQWINTTNNGRFLQLSYPLSSDAVLGLYSLIVYSKWETTEESFTVKDYVLPRFEVKLFAPSKISILEKFLTVGVCANYTYGKPVDGVATLKLCQEFYPYEELPPNVTEVCREEFIRVNDFGCATHVFSLTHFAENYTSDVQHSMHYTVTIEDEATGVTLQKSAYINLDCKIGEISFIEMPERFKPGSIIEGKIKGVYYNNTPIANMSVHVSIWSIDLFQNLITDINGIASFSINTTGLYSVSVQANLNTDRNLPSVSCLYVNRAYHTMHSFNTEQVSEASQGSLVSHSTLTIHLAEDVLPCGKEQQFTVHYTIFGEQADEGPVALQYLVLSKGAIIHHGHMAVPLQDSNVTHGQVSFPLPVTSSMAHEAQLLVYCLLPSKKLVVDSKQFSTEDCFRNKVLLQFSSDKAVPGEDIALQLSAQPGSLCGLTVLDQSVMLMDPGKRLSFTKIFEMPAFSSMRIVPHYIDELEECVHVKVRRSAYPEQLDDFYSRVSFGLFQSLGLKTLTNLVKPLPLCLIFNNKMYSRHRELWYYNQRYVSSGYEHEEKPRTFFPETWIWDLIEIRESGFTKINLTAPDTITSWETEVVCLSAEGLGLASPSQLTVFQPFFLEVSLPYSIVRGEQFELKATVFNYEPKCIVVTVTVAQSTNYTIMPVADSEYSTCVCKWKMFRWTLIPSVLGTVNVTVTAEAAQSQTICDNEVISIPEKGRIDVVTHPLLVKAEGTEKLTTYGWLLCPNGTLLKEEIQLQFPANTVEGSGHGSLSVVGDILGQALHNLDGMLAMPYGCGEQNMALLAPNIYILQYLRATQQLTPALLQKATLFLQTGYQRQMRYQHDNGKFSTFGPGTEVNSWLTAFVMRSFNRMQSFVYVNPEDINNARTWLESLQKNDGCFQTVGKLFNNRMQGGVTDDVTMTGYITASLLEMKVSVTDPVLAKSLTCLRNATGDLTSTYATALLAYTFSLAGETDTLHRLLEHLNTVASNEGGLLYWSPSNSDASSSLSVEMTSYVLLALLSHTRSSNDLGKAARIVSWLVKQQNPHGGFSSTQDTVVALQALSLYATLTYNTRGSTTVTVQSSSKELHQFEVDQSNRLLYQEKVLHHIPGQYTLEVQGTGCVSVQIALHYNVPPPPDTSAFNVKAQTEGNCASTRRRMLHLDVEYSGERNISNMVIVDASMLSGFIPEQEHLQVLKGNSVVDHVSTENGHVLLYLDGILKNTPKNITIELRQEVIVENLKPAVVKVYDYYQPSDYVVTEYIFKCAQD
ncbi:alpha-1-macroglobulin-like [Arapaima gigas]